MGLTMSDEFQVYERPEGQQVWVVRASSGEYVNHFVKGNEVAIGHLDILNIPTDQVASEVDFEKVENALLVKESSSKGSITSHINQVKGFIHKMQVGDLVVTLDSNNLRIGRVISDAYFSQTPVEIVHNVELQKKTQMNFHLRRKVSWGPGFKRSDVPTAMEKTLRAHQTVFSIDHYWESVYHLIYPVFTYKDTLYLSANIRQQKDIDNYSIARFLTLLTDIEVIAKSINLGDNGMTNSFNELLILFKSNDTFTLSTKAEFMSAGTIWGKIKLPKTNLATAAIIYMGLFGGSGIGFQFDGIIDVHMREQILNFALESMSKNDGEDVKRKLELHLPKHDTQPLEDVSKDQPTLNKTLLA